MPSPRGRFDPITIDSDLNGQECPLCLQPLRVGDRPTLIEDRPADPEEARRKAMGMAYNALARVVHETCVYNDDGTERAGR